MPACMDKGLCCARERKPQLEWDMQVVRANVGPAVALVATKSMECPTSTLPCGHHTSALDQ